jgi:exodeoxyribonuclease VII large subunit
VNSPVRQVQSDALSVTTALELVRRPLRDVMAAGLLVKGEISDWRRWKGYALCVLRDPTSQVNVVLPPAAVRTLPAAPEPGGQVVVEGRWEIFRGRGTLQIRGTRLWQLDTEGLRHAEYRRVQAGLAAAGLLDPARKRRIPPFPDRIGVVAAAGSAALADVLAVIERRAPWVQVMVSHAAVQGRDAVGSVPRALELLSRALPPPDVILVARGGGATEDLWAFNSLPVAETIALCPIPIISAIGHECDLTLSDLVADVGASTPSAAAELATPDRLALLAELQGLRSELRLAGQNVITAADSEFALLTAALHQVVERRTSAELLEFRDLRMHLLPGYVGRRIDALAKAHASDAQALTSAVKSSLGAGSQLLESVRGWLREWSLDAGLAGRIAEVAALKAQLGALSPLAILERGYAVLMHGDSVVDSSAAVTKGALLRVILHDGELLVEVRSSTPATR